MVGAPAELCDHLEQQLVVGQAPQLLVELVVAVVQDLQVTRLRRGGHPVDDGLQAHAGLRRPQCLDALDDQLLEHHAQAGDLLQRALREQGNASAAARQPLDQPLLLEPGERLAHGDVADAQLLGDLSLDQPVAGLVRARADGRTQPPGDGVRQALVGKRLEEGLHTDK